MKINAICYRIASANTVMAALIFSFIPSRPAEIRSWKNTLSSPDWLIKPPALYAVICATKFYRLVKLVVGLRKYLWGNRQKDDRQKLVFHSV